MFTIEDGREHFYQWDSGRRLILDDASIKQVHFANRADSCSLVCETYVENGKTLVNVPNILLQTDWKIRVYAFDGEATMQYRVYEVARRTKPADYVYTETEVINWEAMQAYMEAEVEKVNKAVEEAAEELTKAVEDTVAAANNAIDEMSNTFTNALKGSAKGEIIGIADISPVEHNVAVKAASKNLFNNDTSLIKEVTYKNSSGVSNKRFGHELWFSNGSYVLSGNIINQLSANSLLYGIVVDNNNTSLRTCHLIGDGTTVTNQNIVINEGEHLILYNGLPTGTLEQTKSLFASVQIQLEKGTTATAYTPFVPDVSAANVKVYGKNLLNVKVVSPIAVNAEGVKRYGWDLGTLPQGNYTLSVYGNYDLSKAISYKIITDGVYGDYVSFSDVIKSKTIALDGTQGLIVYLFQGVTDLYDNVTLQLEVGTAATPYEPYIEPTSYPIASDGTVEGVTSIYPNMTITTDTTGVVVDCAYNRDINKAFAELQQAIISTGGNI